MSLETRLETVTQEFQKIQKDLSNAIEARQRLDSQLQENEIVQKEFNLLKDDANIYKLIGPVLVKQEKTEAVSNVAKRLEYIRSEIKRVEAQLQDYTQKSESKKTEVIKIQTEYQTKLQQQKQTVVTPNK
ncbi:10660_t:CDS:2 [Ambispora gerdemannii]|uniref:10660_t:CDS:1 n=1 Tax=Ambispora gerdemannii TaxID=144530 RepID=A0A9N8YP23_9GLOM|nr:10660_t:CDS:2 [Ambispora gerdemannii]